MQPLWLCPPRLLLLYFSKWAGLFSNNIAERNHCFPSALPSEWGGVCLSVWYIGSHPHHCRWLSYLQWFMASLSSPLQWEEIFIHSFFFGLILCGCIWVGIERKDSRVVFSGLCCRFCVRPYWNNLREEVKWVRWNSKAKWKERKKEAVLFFIPGFHTLRN